MSIFDTAIVSLIVETLGWTLLHFVWQGALLGVAFFLAMAAMKDATARSRYHWGLALFLLTAAAPVITFISLYESNAVTSATESLAAAVVGAGTQTGTSAWLGWEQTLAPFLPWAVAFWLAGVMLMSARVSFDWLRVRRLVHVRVSIPPKVLCERAHALAEHLKVSRKVRMLCSEVVRVPAVVGWLKPVILLPTAALVKLERRQLELIIAHELAHIRRADYLVNLFQVIIETLLFYHPAVRWMSERIRAERELCCDDEVVQVCGDPLTYAKALAELESQRLSAYQTALAASGGQLSQRIHRMLERPAPRHGAMIWGTGLLLGVTVCSVALAAQLALAPAPPAPPEAPVAALPSLPEIAPSATVKPQPDPSNTPAKPAPAVPAAVEDSMPRAAAPAPANSAPDETPEITLPAPPPALETAPSPNPPSVPVESAPVDSSADTRAPEAAPDLMDRSRQTLPAEPLIIAKRKAVTPAVPQPPEVHITGGELLHLEAPRYPRRARVRGQEGEVIAEFTINKQGRVSAIDIVEARPAGIFDTAVKEALDGWVFEPLVKDGEVIARRVSKSFVFSLEHGISSSDNDCDLVTGTRICQ